MMYSSRSGDDDRQGLGCLLMMFGVGLAIVCAVIVSGC
jgi:hypothetical protein